MRMEPLAEVKLRFSEYVKECRNGPVIVTKNGRATAALVPIESDEDLEKLLLSHSKILKKLYENAEMRFKNKKGIKHKDFWNLMDK